MQNWLWGVQPGGDCRACANVYLGMRTLHKPKRPSSKQLLSDSGHHSHHVGKCSYCTRKAVDSVACECVWAAPGSVCSVAVQRPAHSQSSHLPGDRREIEAVFAQLTPSHSQDKHTALYTQAHNVRTTSAIRYKRGSASVDFLRWGVLLWHTLLAWVQYRWNIFVLCQEC